MEEGKMDHSVEYQYTRVDTSTACQHRLRELLFPYIHNRGWPLTRCLTINCLFLYTLQPVVQQVVRRVVQRVVK